MVVVLAFVFIKSDEAVKRLDEFTVVDVRSSYEYRIEHIKGAISAPLRFLDEHFKRGIIPTDKPLLFYCGCPHHLSTLAARKAEGMGFKEVFVLDDGFFAWRDKGYPTEGEKKGKRPNFFHVKGKVILEGVPFKYGRIFFVDKKNGQVEMEMTDSKGYYEGRLPFYDIKPGDTVLVYVGTFENSTFFVLPPKKGNRWGARVDIEGTSVKVNPL
ncbi:MAG: rhodanese-like domain-containing protein [Thermotogae bacterium]|nr:rhodanese-like domain-containing protein [Thermotogota bacterium]